MRQKLRIAYDSSGITCPSSGVRGIGRYSTSHLAAILREFPELEVSVLVQSDRDLSRLAPIRNFQNATLIDVEGFRSMDYDVLHLPDPMSLAHSSVESLLEQGGKVPITIIFYDLIPLLMHQFHFNYYGTALAQSYLSRLELLSEKVAHAFTISRSTLNDLVRVVGIPREKCDVIYAGTGFGREPIVGVSVHREKKFFLAVGGLDHHKGFAETATFFIQNFSNKDVELLVVGSKSDGGKERYEKVISEAGITSVHFLGFISDQELASLYSEATALIFPSMYEGFGFPILEAMACGCPVITRRNSSLEEVGGDVALYIEDDSLQGLMRLLLGDERLRETLRIRGRQRASQFTWEEVARKTVARWNSFI
jgi:glycosyltransferase involved in cell wall biosynthesis